MVTKDWATYVGLSTFTNTAREPILLMNGDISQEQVEIFNKKIALLGPIQ